MVNSAESSIDQAFFEVLGKEGFERLPGEALSYTKTTADGRSRLHVDVEVRGYISGFGVTLQEVRAGSATRRRLLEDFEGIRAYGFEAANPETVREALDKALADLKLHGIPWLAGQDVSTPATERVRALAAERVHGDLVRGARERFKAGDYAEALRGFNEARAAASLDAVDEKFRSIAEKKLRGE